MTFNPYFISDWVEMHHLYELLDLEGKYNVDFDVDDDTAYW